MNTYGGVKVQLHAFLTSALDGGERFTSTQSPWYPLDRRLGGPQSRSGCDGKETNPCLFRKSNLQPSHYTDWATPLHIKMGV
jgi:hypothetical protein